MKRRHFFKHLAGLAALAASPTELGTLGTAADPGRYIWINVAELEMMRTWERDAEQAIWKTGIDPTTGRG